MGIGLEAVISPVINSAVLQNHTPVIESVTIINDGDEQVNGLELIVVPEPRFSRSRIVRIKKIDGHQRVRVKNADLNLDPEFFEKLTDHMTGRVRISIELDGNVIAEVVQTVQIFASNEWDGLSKDPESTTAFVLPADPDAIRISAEAARMLDAWTGSAKFDGYTMKDRARVKKQISAIYGAIQQLNITSTKPPFDFETKGCVVRTFGDIIKRRSGTTFDISLLFASCIESIGLSPIIIFIKGKPLVGVWTEDSSFRSTMEGDLSILNRMIRDDMICVVEPSGMTTTAKMDFVNAEAIAKRTLFSDQGFITALDVRLTREDVEPKTSPPTEWAVDKKDKPKSDDDLSNKTDVKDAGELSRKESWESTLLDLSSKNNLLSMRMTEHMMPVMTNDLFFLKDIVYPDSRFEIIGKPAEWDSKILNETPFEIHKSMVRHEKLVEQEFRLGHIRVPFTDSDTYERITSIYRSEKRSVDEDGENTLHLVLGALRWSDEDDRMMYAPLILVPAEIEDVGKKKFVLRIRDDEPIINPVLIEKLKRMHGIDLSELDPLPVDKAGIDLRKVVTKIRSQINTMNRWDIIESAFIGLFSFSKFLMWKDFRTRSDDLFNNKLTKSLMEGRLIWAPSKIEEPTDQDDLFMVTDSDSSQMKVVKTAALGRTFVAQGPPGTGKSEAIVNIISDTLSKGKTVLFISEKGATLRATYQKLDDIGIGPFCLELHSNLTERKDVFAHLKSAMESASRSMVEDYENKAFDIKEMRVSLDDYPKSIHRIGNSGISLYEAAIAYDALNDNNTIEIVIPDILITRMTSESISKWKNTLENLVKAARKIGHPTEHPLTGIMLSTYVASDDAVFKDAINDWLLSISSSMTAARELVELMKIPIKFDKTGFKEVNDAANTLLALEDIPAGVLNRDSIIDVNDDLRLFIKSCRHAFEVIDNVYKTVDRTSMEQDIDILKEQVDKIRSVMETIKDISMSGVNYEDFRSFTEDIVLLTIDMSESISMLRDLRVEWKDSILDANVSTISEKWKSTNKRLIFSGGAKKEFMKEMDRYLKNLFVTFDRFPETLLPVTEYMEKMEKIHASLARLGVINDGQYSKLDGYIKIIEKTESKLTSRRKSLSSYGDPDTIFRTFKNTEGAKLNTEAYVKSNQKMNEKRRVIEDLFVTNISECTETDTVYGWIDLGKKWLDHISDLKDYTEWNSWRNKATSDGLLCVIDIYLTGADHDLIIPSFEKALYASLIKNDIAGDPVLSNYNSNELEKKINKFYKMDEEYYYICRAELRSRLASAVPNMTMEAAKGSEMGILQKTVSTNGRNTTVREILSSIPNILPKICPCILMSPASAARYLNPNHSFDIVIFDEASQITTQRAVGLITRGKSVVIFGDPKQLPPVIVSPDTKDSDDPTTIDVKSMVDDCFSIGLPVIPLTWHYRSRHESLIAFSNKRFYDGKLNTFPSYDDMTPAVSLVRVDGVYDRTGTKTNVKEAEAIIREVTRRLKDKELRKNSIGIIAFNSQQRNLIDDMLRAELGKYSVFTEHIRTGNEPLFIKDVDSVQGDERDIILISTNFGPDKTGRMTSQMDSLAKPAGASRINVAATRARQEMIIFTSVKDKSLTSSSLPEGIKALKGLIEYAENEGVSPKEKSANTNTISKKILHSLKEKGYEAHLDVGRSNFRVDIAVISPHKNNEYVLAIMMDGGTYRFSGIAKERELAHMMILNDRGWNVHRVRIMDWIEDENREIRKILSLLDAIKADPARCVKKSVKNNEIKKELIKKPKFRSTTTTETGLCTPYVKTKIPSRKISDTELFSEHGKAMIEEDIEKIVATEGPVADSVITKRLIESYETDVIQQTLRDHISSILKEADVFIDNTPWNTSIVWKDNKSSSWYKMYRTATENDRRTIREIAPEEIANSAFDVMKNNISMSSLDLIKEMARVLGISKLNPEGNEILMTGIDIAVKKDWLIRDKNQITLNNNL